ncbi:MAG: ABC transporter substrate-binding protein [Proteobacteria bacterium]|nr:ABC transporter substrate-binding protein [Pseudomonadota bacterium]
MKRFLILTAILFGFMLSYQILKITAQRKYMAQISTKETKGKTLKIVSPDFFTERNIYESFAKRYEANLKYTLRDRPEGFRDIQNIADVVIYPSYIYKSFIDGKIAPLENEKIKNIENLMENYLEITRKSYSVNGKIYAIPVAYSPYAIYFNPSKVVKSTKGRELINKNYKIALADDIGSMLTLFKIFDKKPEDKGLNELIKILSQKPTFFNIDNPAVGMATLQKEKPDVIIAPSYLKGFFEREVGSLEAILPDEGTFSTLYLISNVKGGDNELGYIFINHILDPLIQKNLTDIMGLGITNKTSLTSISAVNYNFLKMNYPEYLSKLYILNSEDEYQKAVQTFTKFKNN